MVDQKGRQKIIPELGINRLELIRKAILRIEVNKNME